MIHTARTWRLNLKALLILVCVVVVASAGFAGSWVFQSYSGRGTLLKQAEFLAQNGQDNLAQSYLNEYLNRNPRDAIALDLKSEIMTRSARSPKHIFEASKLAEQALRLAPDSPQSQKTRRRLIENHLKLTPYLGRNGQLRTADLLAQDLIQRGDHSADALRLRARVLEQIARLGDTSTVAEAIKLYEQARIQDRGNVPGAENLALLYRDLAKTPAKATAVLDDLLAANPTEAAAARLARFRYYARDIFAFGARRAVLPSREDAVRADAELQKAIEIAPTNVEIRLTAAQWSVEQNRIEEARRHLEAIPESARSEYRVRLAEGIGNRRGSRYDEAIASWSSGLLITGGTDDELTWRLAFVLLQLGRIEEAEPLITQYRRLSGGSEPTAEAVYLEALKNLRQNRPVLAIHGDVAGKIPGMEQVRVSVPAVLAGQFYYTLGQCYETVRNEPLALEHYMRSIQAEPKLPAPRLARVRLLQTRRPDEADAELRTALGDIGEEPSLLVALARIELRRQFRLLRDKRSWDETTQLLERARKVAPGDKGLILAQADFLQFTDRLDEAVDLLDQATQHDKHDPDLWLARAEKLAQQGKLEQALLVLEQAAAPEAAGDQASLRIARARLMTYQGHGQEAREFLIRDDDRVRADQRPKLWAALGDLYLIQRDRAAARQAYSQWARLLPDDPLPRLFLLEQTFTDPDPQAQTTASESLAHLNQTGGLFGRVAQAMALLRDPPEEKNLTGNALTKAQTNRFFDAERLIKSVIDEAPEQRYGPFLLGQLRERQGRDNEAIEAYDRALHNDGGESSLAALVKMYVKKGDDRELARLRRDHGASIPNLTRYQTETSLRQGDKDRAEKLAQLVVDGEPTSLDVRIWHARVLNTLGKPEKAEATLRELINRQPDQAGPWMALLFFQVGRKQMAQAAVTVEQIQAQVKTANRPEFLWAQCWRVAANPTKADQYYQKALAQWPSDPQVARGAADYYEATGRPELAERVLRDILARDITQRWAQRALALFASARPNNAAAWREAWGLVNAVGGTDTPEDRLARAIVLIRGPEPRQRDDAIAQLERLVADLPPDLPTASTARSVLVQIYLQTGKADKAVPLAAVDAASGTRPAALLLYATALIRANQLTLAATTVDRLTALAPDELSTFAIRARLLHAQGKAAEAAALLEKTFRDRADQPAGEQIGRDAVRMLMDIEQLVAAERVAADVAKRWPRSAGLLATVTARQGRQEEALSQYQSALGSADATTLREISQNVINLVTTGRRDNSRLARAETILDAALKKEPNSPELLTMVAYIRHFQKRYADELQLYRDALAKNPQDLRFLNNMAWTLSEGLQQHAEALKRIDEAFQLTGQRIPQFLDTRGVIYYRLGRIKEAIADLEEAAAGRPSGAILAHLARAYYLAGRTDDYRKTRDLARKADLTADELDPNDRAELEPLMFGPEPAAAKAASTGPQPEGKAQKTEGKGQ